MVTMEIPTSGPDTAPDTLKGREGTWWGQRLQAASLLLNLPEPRGAFGSTATEFQLHTPCSHP
jgi:hypothetical protein